MTKNRNKRIMLDMAFKGMSGGLIGFPIGIILHLQFDISSYIISICLVLGFLIGILSSYMGNRNKK